jgi:hypothetical protein
VETPKDIFDVFLHDENYKYIMKRLLEASIFGDPARSEMKEV